MSMPLVTSALKAAARQVCIHTYSVRLARQDLAKNSLHSKYVNFIEY